MKTVRVFGREELMQSFDPFHTIEEKFWATASVKPGLRVGRASPKRSPYSTVNPGPGSWRGINFIAGHDGRPFLGEEIL
jgi:hypothetical protein